LHGIVGERGGLGKAELQVVDHRGRVPHELAVGRLDDGDAARIARGRRLGAHAREAAEAPRDALVVEVAGHLPREVGLHHAVHAVGPCGHRVRSSSVVVASSHWLSRPAVRWTPIACTCGSVAISTNARRDGYSTSATTWKPSPPSPMTCASTRPVQRTRPPFASTKGTIASA